MTILKLGATGDEVRSLQDALNAVGATPSPLQSDGIFGPNTLTAVRAFQQCCNLTVDGIVGPLTGDALLKAVFSIALAQ